MYIQKIIEGRGQQDEWVRFFGPVTGKTAVDSFMAYAALLGQAGAGAPSGLSCEERRPVFLCGIAALDKNADASSKDAIARADAACTYARSLARR